ncbi:hypothetical protein Trydic_g11673 [Trypoxylus dichotomus]
MLRKFIDIPSKMFNLSKLADDLYRAYVEEREKNEKERRFRKRGLLGSDRWEDISDQDVNKFPSRLDVVFSFQHNARKAASSKKITSEARGVRRMCD